MDREVKRCGRCLLNQFILASRLCRKCKQSFDPVVVPPPPEVLSGPPIIITGSLCSQVLPPILLYLRLRLGLSQRQMGKRLGVPRTWLTKVEHWKTCPKPLTIFRLATALETTPEHIFTMCEALVL